MALTLVGALLTSLEMHSGVESSVCKINVLSVVEFCVNLSQLASGTITSNLGANIVLVSLYGAIKKASARSYRDM